ncbi:pseudouridine synthase [Lapillicoccus jejuensis]|uniref:RNA pseudouridylate synthase n=1 Tax=Lapillicoccus jejuensis TaxID=402171 RepID=A0A542E6Q0_9MICO|nr:pseudouridine synthase [Lapillicoccus jejuensis]TQJ11013.1 tRNA pseudouridine32 synthase/23S rRNA pseudouridine746 synthase [Lapillicoccus jejuensis]
MARGPRPRSPFPQQDGVDAARLRLPPGPWPTVAAHLVARLGPVGPDGVARLLAEGRVRGADGEPVDDRTPYRPGGTVWVRRELEPEPVVPLAMPVLHEDERLVVVDKPPFLASTPRGRHVRETALARARRATGRPDLVPAHRLDRLTSGVLLLVGDPRHRGAYQELFARREVAKTYLALAPVRPGATLLTTVALHLAKDRGDLRARVVPGRPPNSETRVELVGERDGVGLHRLTPTTGRTHQLRAHLAHLGTPILHDPLYGAPDPAPDTPDTPDDLARPLALLAARLVLTDPVDGRRLVLTSGRTLSGWDRAELLAALDGPPQDAGAPAT